MRGAVNSRATRSIIVGALLVATVGSVTIHFIENESRDSARDAAHDGISLTPQPPRGDSRDVTDRGLGTSAESSRLLVSTGGDAQGGSQVGQDDGESLDVLLGDEDEEIGSGDAPKDEERLRRRLSRTDVLCPVGIPPYQVVVGGRRFESCAHGQHRSGVGRPLVRGFWRIGSECSKPATREPAIIELGIREPRRRDLGRCRP